VVVEASLRRLGLIHLNLYKDTTTTKALMWWDGRVLDTNADYNDPNAEFEGLSSSRASVYSPRY